MPRTKQQKMTKKMKKEMNASDLSIASNSSNSNFTFKSRKDVTKALEAEFAEQMKLMDDMLESQLKEIDKEHHFRMMNCSHKNLLKTTTMKDFVAIAKKSENPEYVEAMKACLSGTYLPPPTLILPDLGDKAGSSVKSYMASTISSGSLRPPSSASSMRSGHSHRAGNKGALSANTGSVRRSRSVVKAPHQHQDSGVRRRSMSQPYSQKKTYHNLPVGNTPIITPKVHPKNTSTVLRLPKTGENLYSLGGSPVLANALASSSEDPQALIPLRDGKMLAVLPSVANSTTYPMEFSPATRRKLMLLKENLEFLTRDI